jgi:DtxR family Mn-dependent transcriptional regulator
MLQKLAAAPAPLVKYERHRGVQLSRSGRKRALEIVRHHRLIETFLYRVLDYPLEEVHAEAERLEHFISERFEERIAAKLGHPTIDPHGHSIPTLKGEVAASEAIVLADVVDAGMFRIDSVSDRDERHVRWMEARGMTPGARLRVRATPSAAGYTLSVGRGGKPFVLPHEVARQVKIVRMSGN